MANARSNPVSIRGTGRHGPGQPRGGAARCGGQRVRGSGAPAQGAAPTVYREDEGPNEARVSDLPPKIVSSHATARGGAVVRGSLANGRSTFVKESGYSPRPTDRDSNQWPATPARTSFKPAAFHTVESRERSYSIKRKASANPEDDADIDRPGFKIMRGAATSQDEYFIERPILQVAGSARESRENHRDEGHEASHSQAGRSFEMPVARHTDSPSTSRPIISIMGSQNTDAGRRIATSPSNPHHARASLHERVSSGAPLRERLSSGAASHERFPSGALQHERLSSGAALQQRASLGGDGEELFDSGEYLPHCNDERSRSRTTSWRPRRSHEPSSTPSPERHARSQHPLSSLEASFEPDVDWRLAAHDSHDARGRVNERDNPASGRHLERNYRESRPEEKHWELSRDVDQNLDRDRAQMRNVAFTYARHQANNGRETAIESIDAPHAAKVSNLSENLEHRGLRPWGRSEDGRLQAARQQRELIGHSSTAFDNADTLRDRIGQASSNQGNTKGNSMQDPWVHADDELSREAHAPSSNALQASGPRTPPRIPGRRPIAQSTASGIAIRRSPAARSPSPGSRVTAETAALLKRIGVRASDGRLTTDEMVLIARAKTNEREAAKEVQNIPQEAKEALLHDPTEEERLKVASKIQSFQKLVQATKQLDEHAIEHVAKKMAHGPVAGTSAGPHTSQDVESLSSPHDDFRAELARRELRLQARRQRSSAISAPMQPELPALPAADGERSTTVRSVGLLPDLAPQSEAADESASNISSSAYTTPSTLSLSTPTPPVASSATQGTNEMPATSLQSDAVEREASSSGPSSAPADRSVALNGAIVSIAGTANATSGSGLALSAVTPSVVSASRHSRVIMSPKLFSLPSNQTRRFPLPVKADLATQLAAEQESSPPSRPRSYASPSMPGVPTGPRASRGHDGLRSVTSQSPQTQQSEPQNAPRGPAGLMMSAVAERTDQIHSSVNSLDGEDMQPINAVPSSRTSVADDTLADSHMAMSLRASKSSLSLDEEMIGLRLKLMASRARATSNGLAATSSAKSSEGEADMDIDGEEDNSMPSPGSPPHPPPMHGAINPAFMRPAQSATFTSGAPLTHSDHSATISRPHIGPERLQMLQSSTASTAAIPEIRHGPQASDTDMSQSDTVSKWLTSKSASAIPVAEGAQENLRSRATLTSALTGLKSVGSVDIGPASSGLPTEAMMRFMSKKQRKKARAALAALGHPNPQSVTCSSSSQSLQRDMGGSTPTTSQSVQQSEISDGAAGVRRAASAAMDTSNASAMLELEEAEAIAKAAEAEAQAAAQAAAHATHLHEIKDKAFAKASAQARKAKAAGAPAATQIPLKDKALILAREREQAKLTVNRAKQNFNALAAKSANAAAILRSRLAFLESIPPSSRISRKGPTDSQSSLVSHPTNRAAIAPSTDGERQRTCQTILPASSAHSPAGTLSRADANAPAEVDRCENIAKTKAAEVASELGLNDMQRNALASVALAVPDVDLMTFGMHMRPALDPLGNAASSRPSFQAPPPGALTALPHTSSVAASSSETMESCVTLPSTSQVQIKREQIKQESASSIRVESDRRVAAEVKAEQERSAMPGVGRRDSEQPACAQHRDDGQGPEQQSVASTSASSVQRTESNEQRLLGTSERLDSVHEGEKHALFARSDNIRYLVPVASRAFTGVRTNFDALVAISKRGKVTTALLADKAFAETEAAPGFFSSGKPDAPKVTTASVEDAIRISTKAVAIVASVSNTSSEIAQQPPQLTLCFVHLEEETSAPALRWNLFEQRPHTHGATCVSTYPRTNPGGLDLATGGSDGVVYSWRWNSRDEPNQPRSSVHRVHDVHAHSNIKKNGGVLAVTQMHAHAMLVSAGGDGFIVAYDVVKGRVADKWATSDHVRHLQRGPSSHLLLASLLRPDYDQFKIFVSAVAQTPANKKTDDGAIFQDVRSTRNGPMSRPVLTFGWQASTAPTLPGRGSWHPSRKWLFTQPCEDGYVRLWDTRMPRADPLASLVCSGSVLDSVWTSPTEITSLVQNSTFLNRVSFK